MRTKCVRSNRYTEGKLADKIEKLNVNKHLFCVQTGKICNILLLIEICMVFGHNEYSFMCKR